MRTLWAFALLVAVAESLTIQDAAITSGNGEDEDNPAEEGKYGNPYFCATQPNICANHAHQVLSEDFPIMH